MHRSLSQTVDRAKRLITRVLSGLSLKPHPFRVLLYLEWVLLSISLINPLFVEIEFFQYSSGFLFWTPIVAIQFWLLLCMFGLMGLYLPKGSAVGKIAYTAVSFAIIGLACNLCCWESVFLAPLLLIVAIRSCLLFKKVGQVIIALAIFIFFAVSNSLSWQAVWDLPLLEPIIIIEEPTIDAAREELDRMEAWLEHSPAEPIETHIHNHHMDIFQIQLQNAFFFGLVLVFVLLLVNALLSERQNRRRLASAHAQLYEYALKIEDQATLEERNRIARDIHDSLGHILMAQSIQLDNGLFFLANNENKAKTFFEAGKKHTDKALTELRQSVATLRNSPLQGETLESAIARIVNNFKQLSNIETVCDISLRMPVPLRVSSAVYRIVEEVLTNIHKHAQASRVGIMLNTYLSNEGLPKLLLKIEDNGCGFWVDQNAMGFGLKGMRERAAAISCQLEIASVPGEGSCISGRFPLDRLTRSARSVGGG